MTVRIILYCYFYCLQIIPQKGRFTGRRKVSSQPHATKLKEA